MHSLVQDDMLTRAAEPLHTSYNMSDIHRTIVYNVSEVIGGKTIRLEQDHVALVYALFYLTEHFILNLESVVLNIARKRQHPIL